MDRPSRPGKPSGFSVADLRILGVVVLVLAVVAVVALWPRGDDDDPGPAKAADSPTSSGAAVSSDPSGRVSDAEWCADFRALAADQAQYVGGGGTADQLLQAARDLAELGLPASMPSLAVGGWWALLDGVFESLQESPPPGTFLDDPPADQGQYEAEEAFTAYTTEYCPA